MSDSKWVMNEFIDPHEQQAFDEGFQRALNLLASTGADLLSDAIAEAKEADPGEPWDES